MDCLKRLCDRVTSSLWNCTVCCHGDGRGAGAHGNETGAPLAECVCGSKRSESFGLLMNEDLSASSLAG